MQQVNPPDRRALLRVKVNSLAQEARIIRRSEAKHFGPLRNELHNHRVVDVRREARAAHLALGFIKGRTLTQMEARSYAGSRDSGAPDWKRVRRLLQKYGPRGMARPVDFPEQHWNAQEWLDRYHASRAAAMKAEAAVK